MGSDGFRPVGPQLPSSFIAIDSPSAPRDVELRLLDNDSFQRKPVSNVGDMCSSTTKVLLQRVPFALTVAFLPRISQNTIHNVAIRAVGPVCRRRRRRDRIQGRIRPTPGPGGWQRVHGLGTGTRTAGWPSHLLQGRRVISRLLADNHRPVRRRRITYKRERSTCMREWEQCESGRVSSGCDMK